MIEREIQELCKQWDQWYGKRMGRFGEMQQRFKEKQADLTTLTGSVSLRKYSEARSANFSSFAILRRSARRSLVRSKLV
jgi:hypothetical protein